MTCCIKDMFIPLFGIVFLVAIILVLFISLFKHLQKARQRQIRRCMLVASRRSERPIITGPGIGEIRVGNYVYTYNQSDVMIGSTLRQFNENLLKPLFQLPHSTTLSVTLFAASEGSQGCIKELPDEVHGEERIDEAVSLSCHNLMVKSIENNTESDSPRFSSRGIVQQSATFPTHSKLVSAANNHCVIPQESSDFTLAWSDDCEEHAMFPWTISTTPESYQS